VRTTGLSQQMRVSQGKAQIANGGSCGFAAQTVNTFEDRIFTIENRGVPNLVLGGLNDNAARSKRKKIGDADGVQNRPGQKDNKRQTESPNGDPYYFYSFDGKLMAEYDDSGNCVSDYIYAGNRLMAEYRPQEAKYYYYTPDQINSTRMVTDSTGAVVYSVTFDPFGGIQKTWVSTYGPTLKFSGKEREPSNEMDYFGARSYTKFYYRWLSVDPVIDKQQALNNPQLWNLYAFCRNNPVTYVDPDGLELIKVNLPMSPRATNFRPFLDDTFFPTIQKFINLAEEAGIHLKFLDAFRTRQDQTNINNDKKNTNPKAPPGNSLHEAGWAIDVDMDLLNPDQRNKLEDIARKIGLGLGKDFPVPDANHFYKDPSDKSGAIKEAEKKYETLSKDH